VTVEAEERSLRYQGVVPLAGRSLAESLETYFASSEQLPTRVRLAADDRQVAGLLVQKLPEAAADEATHSAWQAAQHGIELLDGERLLNEPPERLLAGTFSGHDLRLFRGGAVQFECRCSVDRVTGLLRALGADEVRDVLKEQGSVTVTCEFCQRPYRFDAIDVEGLFKDGPPSSGSVTLH